MQVPFSPSFPQFLLGGLFTMCLSLPLLHAEDEEKKKKNSPRRAIPVEVESTEKPKPAPKASKPVREKSPSASPAEDAPKRIRVLSTLMIRNLEQESQLDVFAATQCALLSSQTVQSRARQALREFQPELKGRAFAKASPIPGTRLLKLEVEGPHDTVALAYAERVLEEYKTFLIEIRDMISDSRIEAVSEKLMDMEGELNSVSEDAATHREQNDIKSLGIEAAKLRPAIEALHSKKEEVSAEDNAHTKLPLIGKQLREKTNRLAVIEKILQKNENLTTQLRSIREDIQGSLAMIEQESFASALKGAPVIVIEAPYVDPKGAQK